MALDDILKMVPIDDIAAKFGVSPEVAKSAVEQGGTALLSGIAKNAESDEGSAAIQKALQKHAGATGAAKVDDIDQADGGKIVAHVFGDRKNDVAEKLTNDKQTAGIDFGKLLPILAPIVMGLIAKGAKSKAEPQSGSGGGIGDLIGGLLGGSASGSGSNSGGSNSGGGLDIGGLLGGLLGGKK